jgi:hypothetical protein
MRLQRGIALLAAAAFAPAAAFAVPAAPALTRSPSAAQVRAAVKAAEHSKALWATINICNPRHHRHELGIRAQIPSLGFSARMYVTFEVAFRPTGASAFTPLPASAHTVFVANRARALEQAGETYSFQPPAVLSGIVTFQWRRGGRVLGRVTRRTTAHHHHADFGDPPGYSAAICTIP